MTVPGISLRKAEREGTIALWPWKIASTLRMKTAARSPAFLSVREYSTSSRRMETRIKAGSWIRTETNTTAIPAAYFCGISPIMLLNSKVLPDICLTPTQECCAKASSRTRTATGSAATAKEKCMPMEHLSSRVKDIALMIWEKQLPACIPRAETHTAMDRMAKC